jgi:hypothetical protein
VKPKALIIATSVPGGMSTNSAGKLGATIADTGSPDSMRLNARCVSSRTCFAFCVHTRRQLPQPMHRGWMTLALPFSTLIALAGHSRTQA